VVAEKKIQPRASVCAIVVSDAIGVEERLFFAVGDSMW
jgi:hypothetical protein